jgi:outer membrane protein assembly factor BamB
MKPLFRSFSVILLSAASFLILFTLSCKDNNDDPDNNKTPVWIYNTTEIPYQSKPCVVGDKVIVCSHADGVDHHFTHCIDRNTGTSIWKYADSTTGVLNPVVYNNYVILGGWNPHALNLNNGNPEWIYVDDLIPRSTYSNALLVDNHVYFASLLSFTKHAAGSGELIWETEGMYTNLRYSRPVFKNGTLYYCDMANTLTAFDEATGQIGWTLTFEGAFTNFPAVTDNEIFIGIETSDVNVNTLRCINLDDRTEKWAVKIGIIQSDIVVSGDKVFAIGITSLHCRSAIDGSAIWQYDMPAGSVCEPLVTGDKVIVGNGDQLLCLNASTGELIWKYVTGDRNGFSSSTLDGDKIFVSCGDGNVYCFNID